MDQNTHLRRWCHATGAVAPRTLYRWLRAYRRGGLAGLIDRRRRARAGAPAWSPEAMAFIVAQYADENGPNVAVCRERAMAIAADQGWTIPGLRTCQAYVAERADARLIAAGRQPRRFRDRLLPHISRDWSKVAAMECWFADHRRLDVWVPVEEAGRWRWRRPWLTLWIDARTWYPISRAIRFENPDGQLVMSTFCQGVETHGRPEMAYMDNGKDFRARRFAGGRNKRKLVDEEAVEPLLKMLGVSVTWALPYHPQSKTIEPWFRIMSERFDRTFETYLGNKVANKPERIKAMHAKAGEYAEAGLTIDAVIDAFDRWISMDLIRRECPVAASKPRSMQAAFHELRRADFRCTRPASEDLALLLMPSKAVVVRARGVFCHAHQRHYWNEALAERVGASGRDRRRKVIYRWREDDASRIWVFDARTGAFLCAAAPHPAEGIHPLAEYGSADAERLAAAMALRRRAAKAVRDRLASQKTSAHALLLEAQRRGAEADGLLDPGPVTEDGAGSIVPLLGEITRAAATAPPGASPPQSPPVATGGTTGVAEHAVAEGDLPRAAARGLGAEADLRATGTDDIQARRAPNPLERLADFYERESDVAQASRLCEETPTGETPVIRKGNNESQDPPRRPDAGP